MKLLFSTERLPIKSRFERWLEMLEEQRLPLEQEQLDAAPFEAKLEIATLGPLTMTRVSEGPLRSEATPSAIRRRWLHDAKRRRRAGASFNSSAPSPIVDLHRRGRRIRAIAPVTWRR